MHGASERLRFLRQVGAAVFFCFFLSSCAAVSLVDTWHSPTAPVSHYRKLLVASLSKNAENRRVYEEIIVGEFSRIGVEAVASHAVVAGKGRPTRQALLEAARKRGMEALLTVQTVRIERWTDVQPGYVSTSPDFGYPRYPGGYYGPYGGYGYGSGGYGYGSGGYGYGYGGYGATTWYEPPYAYNYDVATIQANLFNSGGTLVWSATMETAEPGRIVKIGKELGKILTRSLIQEGLI